MRTDLSEWPGGVEPVWRLLEPGSVEALRAEPSAANRTLRLAGDLPDEAFGACPHRKGVSQARCVGAPSAASIAGHGRALGGTGGLVPVDGPGAGDAGAGETGRASGDPVPARVLARRTLALRPDVPSRVAGEVAAGRHGRDPVGPLPHGRGVAERGHARHALRRSRRLGGEHALECGGHDVFGTGPRTVALVRAARMAVAAGFPQ